MAVLGGRACFPEERAQCQSRQLRHPAWHARGSMRRSGMRCCCCCLPLPLLCTCSSCAAALFSSRWAAAVRNAQLRERRCCLSACPTAGRHPIHPASDPALHPHRWVASPAWRFALVAPAARQPGSQAAAFVVCIMCIRADAAGLPIKLLGDAPPLPSISTPSNPPSALQWCPSQRRRTSRPPPPTRRFQLVAMPRPPAAAANPRQS